MVNSFPIKKESPNKGTETFFNFKCNGIAVVIKKESPNKGTETILEGTFKDVKLVGIKKESPNKGTETLRRFLVYRHTLRNNKKRIPE